MKTKNTFKAVIAMALALILSLGTMTAAFAANKGDITWTVYDETVSCTYLSDLTVGTSTVAIEESDYYYFDLAALENGYYSVKITDSVFDYFCVPEKSADKYNGWGNGENFFGHDVDQFIFNRNEKTDVAIAGAYGTAESVTIEVEFLGEDIEALEVSDEHFDELLLHYDISEYYTDEYGTGVYVPSDSADIKVERTSYGVSLDTVVTFTGGKTFANNGTRYYFDCEGGLKKGENTVTLNFAGYEFEQVLNVALISDYISGVEIDVPEDAVAYVYYDLYVDLYGYEDAEVIVNFTDGTKQSLKSGSVTLPNGREIDIEVFQTTDGSEVNLNYYAGNQIIEVVELNAKKGSFKDNINFFYGNTQWRIDVLNRRFEDLLECIASGDFGGASVAFSKVFRAVSNMAEGMAYELSQFIKFMF